MRERRKRRTGGKPVTRRVARQGWAHRISEAEQGKSVGWRTRWKKEKVEKGKTEDEATQEEERGTRAA